MTTDTVTVSGGFHAASPITLRICNDKITPHQRKRLWHHMCGIGRCTCQPHHGWIIDGMDDGYFLWLLSHADWRDAQ